MKTPLVSISCTTYNHAHYIRRCFDGFLTQQCDFSFEVLVHDDASTDGTQEIIREYHHMYPELFKPIYQKENQYSKGVRGIMIRYNFPHAQGKYIALCEGDDYWTDPLKLQKQVDFLEGNTEYSLVAGGFISVNTTTGEETTTIRNVDYTIDNTELGFDITLERFFKQWCTKTLTVMLRKEFVDIEVLKKYKYVRDVHLFYHLLKEGKGYYMKQVFGKYHVHQGGIFSERNEEDKYKIYYKVYGELYQKNKNDLLLQNKYYNILSNIEKNKFEFMKPLNLYFEKWKISNSKKDFKKLVKSLF